ncbi:MAG TPA: hypothetical protein VG738_10290 [Chitinophagaceae bacterium]|nr:hypothetical protein [Chitinophagaceae bacterium]
MKYLIILVICSLTSVTAITQADIEAEKDSIVNEAHRMYRSEMASWNGTDILLPIMKDRRGDIAGYFSYPYKDSTRCVFFDKGTIPLTIAVICFDTSYTAEHATIDAIPRKLDNYESSLYAIRAMALAEISRDTIFKTYNNTNLNLVPIIDSLGERVYVLTGPEQDGVIIFGNDYLLKFDSDNKLISKRALHRNMMPAEYGKGKETSVGGVHTHLPETGDLITATDICTLMLYEKFAKWQQYMVISQRYVSIWDCNNNALFTLTREAWDRISKDQGKRHKK